jgi:hypothetical protein
MKKLNAKSIGILLIILGVGGFITAVIISCFGCRSCESGGLPAVSLVFIILGLSFYFPSLLEAKEGTLSTMRVIVLAVVLVFVLTYVKLAWTVESLEELKIDNNWVYILGLAFGAKAIQRYAEDDE